MRKEIIGLTGVIGSGKNYRAEQYEAQGYKHLSFADGVRNVAWETLRWKPRNKKEYEIFKRSTISTTLFFSQESNGRVDANPEKSQDITGRDYLILVGQRFKTIFGEDIWIKLVLNEIYNSNHKKFVISDCRFGAELFHLYCGYYLKVQHCDYRSDRYEIREDERSENLSIAICKLGFKDGDFVPMEEWMKLFKEGY